MARKPRIEYAGAVYHVLNRGDRREPIYRDQQDRSGCGWGGRLGGQWRARPEKQMKTNNM
jgi:hypothetical protein